MIAAVGHQSCNPQLQPLFLGRPAAAIDLLCCLPHPPMHDGLQCLLPVLSGMRQMPGPVLDGIGRVEADFARARGANEDPHTG